MAVSEGETERGNTGYLPRKSSSLAFDDVSFGAWNRLNFKSTRCLEHFEMNTDATMVKNVLKRVENDTKQTMTPIGKGIYSGTSGEDQLKETVSMMWNECEEAKYGDWNCRIWFNSFYLELCLKRWKGKFCLRDWRVLIEKWDFVWRIETFTLITGASEIGKFYSSHWKV